MIASENTLDHSDNRLRARYPWRRRHGVLVVGRKGDAKAPVRPEGRASEPESCSGLVERVEAYRIEKNESVE